jgi:DNA-binding NarL/FixJ family response regulator
LTSVVIADDHPMVRDALARVVGQLYADARVLEAGDFAAVLGCLGSATPDLVLIDLNMPGMDGLDGLRRLREAFPALVIVVASGQDDPATIRAALANGANGFIPKIDPPDLLLQALRVVRAGGIYIPARSLGDARASVVGPGPNASGLTARQLDVLRLLMKGEPNKVIGRQLGLTEGTVKIHIAAILRALQARNRTEAVIRARELGLGRST